MLLQKLSGPHRNQSGHAMMVALVIVTIAVTLVGIGVRRTAGSGRMAARSADYTETERVSDGLIEYVYGRWKAAALAKGQALSAADLNGLTPANIVPTGFSMLPANDPGGDGTLQIIPTDYMGAPVAGTPPRVITYLADYPGWRGYAYNYLASVRLVSNNSSGVGIANKPKAGTRRLFQYIEVPLFQAMYFYEHDLEIYRPAPMIVGGLVHSNSRLLLSGSSDQTGVELTFEGNVSYAGGSGSIAGYTTTEYPIGGPEWAYGYTSPMTSTQKSNAKSKMEDPTFATSKDSQLSKVSRYEPLGNKPAAVIDANDSNPNNDSFRELIEPPSSAVDSSTGSTYADFPEIASRRLYNKAHVVITVNGSSITTSGTSPNYNSVVSVTAQNGTSLTSTQIDTIKKALSKTTIYDEREGKKVDVVNVDLSKVTPVLNAANGFNGVVYIHDVTPTSGTDPEPKTVRLQKGYVLPDVGLTVASQNPVYIQGDYNTGSANPNDVPANSTGNPNNTSSPVANGYTRKPAAVLADAVMFLSNSWNDSNSLTNTTTVNNRVASNTTFNTAIMAGFIPSGWDPDGNGPKAPYGYSGGANNFPRFLENWNNKTCTYFGSMVELFQSKVFIGEWDTGDIYVPPKRRWNFDPQFSTNPPPGSVDAVVITRGTWARL